MSELPVTLVPVIFELLGPQVDGPSLHVAADRIWDAIVGRHSDTSAQSANACAASSRRAVTEIATPSSFATIIRRSVARIDPHVMIVEAWTLVGRALCHRRAAVVRAAELNREEVGLVGVVGFDGQSRVVRRACHEIQNLRFIRAPVRAPASSGTPEHAGVGRRAVPGNSPFQSRSARRGDLNSRL